MGIAGKGVVDMAPVRANGRYVRRFPAVIPGHQRTREPGIHNPVLDYGFRAAASRGPRNDGRLI